MHSGFLQVPISLRSFDWEPQRRPRYVRAQPEHYQRQDLLTRVVLVLRPRLPLGRSHRRHRHHGYLSSVQADSNQVFLCCYIVFSSTLLFQNHIARSRFRGSTLTDSSLINDLLSRCYLGDWFVLNLLAKNTNAYMYRRIVKALAESLREQR